MALISEKLRIYYLNQSRNYVNDTKRAVSKKSVTLLSTVL